MKALCFNPYGAFEKDIIQNGGSQLHMISIMKNRIDLNAKRGAVVKALSFGSKRAHLPECFKPVIDILLDKVFEAAEEAKTSNNYEEHVKNLLAKCFEVINS